MKVFITVILDALRHFSHYGIGSSRPSLEGRRRLLLFQSVVVLFCGSIGSISHSYRFLLTFVFEPGSCRFHTTAFLTWIFAAWTLS